MDRIAKLSFTKMLISTKKLRVYLVSCLFGVLFSFCFVMPAKAGSASLYLAPSSGTFFIGSTFDVSVFVNTGRENINAVEINLKFDPNKLQIASPTAGKSFIEVWVSQPTYSNTTGEISFVGGIPSPGINTSSGLVSTVTFRAIAPGRTTILFLDSSKVLRNDPEGTNILTSTSRGVYNIEVPPPEGPKIFSPTHPDKNKWYKNNNPTFSWEKEEGITNFSYILDQDSAGVPDNKSEGSYTSVFFSDLKDGIWYFHLKAKREGIWGGTSHYSAQIDSTPPAAFTPTAEPSPKTIEKQPLIFFITTDAFSGMDYYQIKYIDITPERKEEISGFFREAVSPYKLPPLDIGKYLIIVRAYDVSENYREGVVKIQILPKGLSITKQGLKFRTISISWWILVTILIIILVLIGFYFWKKHQVTVKSKSNKLTEFGKRIEDHRGRINGIKKDTEYHE